MQNRIWCCWWSHYWPRLCKPPICTDTNHVSMGEVAENGETPYRVVWNKIGYSASVGLGVPRHARWIAGTHIIQLMARTAYLDNAAPAWYSRFGIHSDRCVVGFKTSLTARYSDGSRPNHVCWYPTVPVQDRRFAMRLAAGPLVARHGRIPCTRRRQSSVVLPRLGHRHTLTRTNVSCQSPAWGKDLGCIWLSFNSLPGLSAWRYDMCRKSVHIIFCSRSTSGSVFSVHCALQTNHSGYCIAAKGHEK